jgi:soluble lytic murein transglycosylase-like protein
MKRGIIPGLAAAAVAAALFAIPAEAATGCQTQQRCAKQRITTNVVGLNNSVLKKKTYRVARIGKSVKTARRAGPAVLPANRQRVVALIKSMSPRYGVPTWFALRIAKVESGYNPNARGRAGEYGVFQMKCATARLVGFRGGCRALLNASTNVQWGLKHLQLAMRSSRGNLKLAASKHNGGLGRKRLVRAYVKRVF